MENDEKKTETNSDQSENIDTEEIKETVRMPEVASSVVPAYPEESSSTSTAPALSTHDVEEMVCQLTEGFLSEVQPQLLALRDKTKEITKNQGILIDTIQQENSKYAKNKEVEEFSQMMSVVQSYYIKLRKIKMDMDHLDERLGKLKKRSLKLKEQRQKKDYDEAQRRKQELVLEQELTAKPAK